MVPSTSRVIFSATPTPAAPAIPTPMTVLAGGDDENLGFGTVAANVFGNRSHVEAIGTLLNATNWGNVFRTPNGSDSIVTAGTVGSPTSLSWAFNYQGIFTEACDGALRQHRERYGPGGDSWRHRRDQSDRQTRRASVSPLRHSSMPPPATPMSSLRAARRETASGLSPPPATPMSSLRAAQNRVRLSPPPPTPMSSLRAARRETACGPASTRRSQPPEGHLRRVGHTKSRQRPHHEVGQESQ